MSFVTQSIEENIPENGYVFVFGWSALRGSTINLGDESVVQMSSGDAHSSLLCASGKVYMLGSNEYAQLGLGFKSTKPQRPTLLTGLDDFTITQVACGGIHTLFLTGECQVLACGTNDSGQLGHGYVGVLTSPVLVHGIEDVVQVAAAGSHSAALTASGEVYVWGDNSWSQLAVGHSSGTVRLPTLLPLGKPVAYIGGGSYHSAFITVDGVLLTCGSNFSGQLGTNQPNRHGALHTIPLRAPVVSIACGARHTVVVLVGGDVWAWGDNRHGQVGCPDGDTTRPRLVLAGQKVTQVACGAEHTILITETGRLYAFGKGKDRQLKPDETSDLLKPTVVGTIPYRMDLVACGRDFTLMVSTGVDFDRPSRQSSPVETTPSPSAMDTKLRKTLLCAACNNYMGPPIYLCMHGHSVCHRCSSVNKKCQDCGGVVSTIRNKSLEALGPLAPHISSSCLWCHWSDCSGDHNPRAQPGILPHPCRFKAQGVPLCADSDRRETIKVEPMLDGFLRTEPVKAFDKEFLVVHHYMKDKKSLLLFVHAPSEYARDFAYRLTMQAGGSLTRVSLQRQVSDSPRSAWDVLLYRPLDCFYVPKALLVNFMEHNHLKKCTLDIMPIKHMADNDDAEINGVEAVVDPTETATF